jgi:hypothetical protein
MPYTISGTLEEDARIFVIKESDWTLEYTGEVMAPSFNLEVTAGTKLIACRNSEGIIDVYGNIEAYAPEAVATPQISPNGGYADSNTDITISCATTGATIMYTTDGSEPTTASGSTSEEYTGAFNLTTFVDVTVKAKAFKDDYVDSQTASAYFTQYTEIYYVNKIQNDGWVRNEVQLSIAGLLLYSGYLSGNQYDTLFLIERFKIPRGSTVGSAYLSVWMPTGGNNGYYISGSAIRTLEVANDADPHMPGSAPEYNNKTWIHAYDWQVNHWCCYNQWVTSGNIASAINQVISSGGWDYEHDLLFRITTEVNPSNPTNKTIRDIAGYGTDGENAPKITITWG